MQVSVTADHIDKGIPHCGDRCPVALALNDAGLAEVFVGLYEICYTEGELATPVVVQHFIKAFDEDDKAVKPFSFNLESVL